MATVAHSLTKQEFREQFAGKKPYFEYWFGEAVQKSMPTWLHGILQAILLDFMKRAGYRSGAEVELRIDPNWEPVPDVVGVLRKIEGAYPTEAVDVVIEILSPDDRMTRVLEKCRHYARIGTQAIFWIDPESRVGWIWDRQIENLERVEAFHLPNGRVILLNDVFAELDKQTA